MSGYELHDQLSEQFFRPAGGYFANFSSSVGSTSEEIYSQQAVYFSYTSCAKPSTYANELTSWGKATLLQLESHQMF